MLKWDMIDYVIIGIIGVILAYSAFLVYDHNPPSRENRLRIDNLPLLNITQISYNQNQTAIVNEPTEFDFKELRLNRSDLKDAFDTLQMRDVFKEYPNVVIVLNNGSLVWYYTLRLRRGVVALEPRLYTAGLRIDANVSTFYEFVYAAKNRDSEHITMFVDQMKFSDKQVELDLKLAYAND